MIDIFLYILESIKGWKGYNNSNSELEFFIPFYTIIKRLLKNSILFITARGKQIVNSKILRNDNNNNNNNNNNNKKPILTVFE
ncbi:unnamed protein product [Cunninghamella echinulata]